MSVRLFVGNLPYDATEAELREHFSAVGRVSYLSLPTDRETGQLRGFAFIEFGDSAQAEEAIRRFHNQSFKGRPIAVSLARPREDRPPGGGSPRSSAPRTSSPRLTLNAEPDNVKPPASGSRQSRDFGPDAPPRDQRPKGKSGPRPERASKGPMRERVRGQFFGGEEEVEEFDADADDSYRDEDDLREEDPEKETNEEGLANYISHPKGEPQ
jgi:RNA recognition motif-containing protein